MSATNSPAHTGSEEDTVGAGAAGAPAAAPSSSSAAASSPASSGAQQGSAAASAGNTGATDSDAQAADDAEQAASAQQQPQQQQQQQPQGQMQGQPHHQQQQQQQPHFDMDEFETQQQMLQAHLTGGMGGPGMPLHLIQAQQQREQDQMNAAAAAGGMMGPNGGSVGTIGGIEICRAYLGGRCSRGSACRFVHVENTAGHTPPNPHLCRDWLNGTCQRGAQCRFQHQGISGSKASIHGPGGKPGAWGTKHQVMCHQWASRGRCDYGTACKFSHQRNDKWNESALDEKKLLAAMLSGLSPQEALSQALNSLQASNPAKFGPLDPSQLVNAQMNGGAPGGGPNGFVPGPGMQMGDGMGHMGPPINGPQKRADGSLILCRFFARHGYCKYGVACKFAHAPGMGGGMFPPPFGPNGQMMHGFMGGAGPGMGDQRNSPTNGGGPANQSLASLLALGLKASMMSQQDLIANHAALLAANAMNGGGPNGAPGVPGRVNSPGAAGNNGGGQNGPAGGMPPLDPALASVLAAYLQNNQGGGPMGPHGAHPHAQGQNPAALASLLQQLQGGQGHMGGQGSNSLSPTQQLGGYGGFQNDVASSDAFQAFIQQQQQGGAPGMMPGQGHPLFHPNAFSPEAASAFNAIPNLNSSSSAAGSSAISGAGASTGGNGQGANSPGGAPNSPGTAGGKAGNGQGGNAQGAAGQGGNSGDATGNNGGAPSGNGNGANGGNLSTLMSQLKPYDDDGSGAGFADSDAAGVVGDVNDGEEEEGGQESFNDAADGFSSPSLDAVRGPGGSFDGFGAGTSANGGAVIGGGIGGGPGASISALFSSGLSGPFYTSA